MENEKQNKTKTRKATTQISLGCGSRESGLQAQKAQAAAGCGVSPAGPSAPWRQGEKLDTPQENLEPRVAFRVILWFFFAGGCSLPFWDPALRPGRLQYHTSLTDKEGRNWLWGATRAHVRETRGVNIMTT